MEPLFTTATYFLLFAIVLCMAAAHGWERRKAATSVSYSKGELLLPPPAPPRPLPILGHLHLMAGYKVPYQAFSALRRRMGDIFSLTMGSVPCVVVNGLDMAREVLVTKGAHFDGRPNFRRYNQLFGGDKENSLAFCDWSEVQRVRRDMLKSHVFPRAFSSRFHLLDTLVSCELGGLVSQLNQSQGEPVHVKTGILSACANVFTAYFCNRRYEPQDPDFCKFVNNFDEIFYEVNQGYVSDFIPWLQSLYKRHLCKMAAWSHDIRNFIMESIVEPRRKTFTAGQQSDFLDALLDHLEHTDKAILNWDTALFALEDILGGHSAVGNLIMRMLAYVVLHPEVKDRIREEIEEVTGGQRTITLEDRLRMPYTEATVLETVRHISSPIVPHVANQDSSLGGYHIAKDTVIFINNYDMNMGAEHWEEPEMFRPERFISKEGQLTKPEHFLPFSTGRRSCLGYKMVQYLSFLTLSTLLQHFDILPVEGENYHLTPGSLALPAKTCRFLFHRR